MSSQESVWLDIVEYAEYCGKSISTVRRHIKSGVLEHKFERGKFYIRVSDLELEGKKQEKGDGLEVEVLRVRLENKRLKKRLGELEEDKRDLEMLVGLYESKGKLEGESLR